MLCGACALGAWAALDRDEGAFLVMAQQIMHGRVPYRDLFDHKAPAIYYLLAGLLTLIQSLSVGAQIVTLRLCVVLVNALSALGLLRLGTRWRRPMTGQLAALLWLAASAVPLFNPSQLFTEPFAVCATIWAVERLATRVSVRSAFEAGLLLAAGSLFKQTAILALPSLGLLLFNPGALVGAPSKRRVYRMLVALSGGVGLPWLAVGGAFAALGALQPFIYQVVIVNLIGYPATSNPFEDFMSLGLKVVIVFAGPLILLAGRIKSATYRSRRESSTRDLTLPAIALLAVLQTAPTVAHPYPHYLIQVLPWFALLLAFGLMTSEGRALDERRSGSPTMQLNFFGRLGVAARPVLIALPLVISVALAIESTILRTDPLSRQIAIGAQIARETPANARLLIGPAEPEYYFLSGRSPSVPYLYLLPVNQKVFPPSEVAGVVRAGGFDVVAWWIPPVQPDAPHTDDPILTALRQTYHVAPTHVSDLIIFKRK
jgi:hypothetical protein